MSVKVSDACSESKLVLSGVPQGSVLGPLLFLVYINQLPSFIRSQCKVFADDLKIYLKLSRDIEREDMSDWNVCQNDIDCLVNAAESWGLTLNCDKCMVMRFQRSHRRNIYPESYFINGSPVPFSDCSRDLGVLVDRDLRFHSQTKSVVGKTSGLCANLLSSTLCRSREFMLALYLNHVRPIIEFGSPVWNLGFLGDLRLLEGIQRRWTKKIEGMDELPYHQRLRELNLYSVKGRLLRADLLKYWKIFHGECGIAPEEMFSLNHRGVTRGHRFKIEHVRCVLECHRRSFAVRCVGIWNSLPDNLVGCDSVEAFKRGLHVFLGSVLFDYVE